jgi:hypothetical protein
MEVSLMFLASSAKPIDENLKNIVEKLKSSTGQISLHRSEAGIFRRKMSVLSHCVVLTVQTI